jgi:hypothetical protein
MRHLVSSSLLLVPLCLAAQSHSDISYLLDGVRETAPTYQSSALVVYGEQAFPVVNGRSSWGVREPTVAAARLGKGRMVVMGYTDALEHDGLAVGDTARLLSNLLRWTSGEKTAPKIGVYGIPGLTAQVKRLGIEARDIDLADRGRVDTVVVLARAVTAPDVEPLAQYVRQGGGLVTGARSYMLERVFPHVDLANEMPASRLTALAGIAWAHGEVQPDSPRGLRVEPPAELSHAGKALAAFEESEARRRFLSVTEQMQVNAALSRAARDLPHDDTLILPRLDRALARFQAGALATAAMPMALTDTPWRLAIVRATERARHAEPEEVRAHPAAAEFPGAVPSGAPRIAATVRVETSGGRWGWFGTGLFAAPGEVITVKVPAAAVRRGLGIQIGAHTDTLYELPVWSRMPDVTVWRPIRSAEVRAASAFGGAIYLDVPPTSGAGDFEVTISGAVAAPRFVLGKTDLVEWRSTIRTLPAPWAEIESDKIALSVPSRFVRELDDPEALMRTWDEMSDLVRNLAGLPKEPRRAERLVPDVQIEDGVDHNG